MTAVPTTPEIITDTFLDEIADRLANNQRVRRTLPYRGRLHIDRQLPFLCVYRRPSSDREARGTDRLIIGQASYLVASGAKDDAVSLHALVERLAATLSPVFKAFLLIELWAARHEGEDCIADRLPLRPGFRVVLPKKRMASVSANELATALKEIHAGDETATVDIEERVKVAPPGMAPILPADRAAMLNVYTIGLEVDPIFYCYKPVEFYPQVLNDLQRPITDALKRCAQAFTCERTSLRSPHYHALGRHASVKAVHDVDERLATISQSFDFLLQVTPVNVSEAWERFKRGRYEREPVFHYRPIPADPELLKRGLFNIPVEQVEDPTLAYLFREKQEELDQQITMLRERGTASFRYEGLQLYGGVSDELLTTANELMGKLPSSDRTEESKRQCSDTEFAAIASDEFHYYRDIYPQFESQVEIRDDVAPGLVVSSGCLLIGKGTAIPRNRADALLQHEVGTHVLTWCNGHAQPLRQLYCGLAGYEEFQEGIAVLAEYLVGGLSSSRLRLLAGRVIAVDAMTGGASFVETFKLLRDSYGFSSRTAFTITMRVYRGGGLAKDAIYLRGIQSVLQYLRDGGDIDPLFVGKIAAHHVPVIQELRLRNVLIPAPLLPRYLTRPEVRQRLQRVGAGISIHELAEKERGA